MAVSMKPCIDYMSTLQAVSIKKKKIGVSIIDSIPHCHTEKCSEKGAKARNVASFLYSGKMEYLSSIVFHSVILKIISNEAKSRNVASLLYRGQSWSISTIDTIPH